MTKRVSVNIICPIGHPIKMISNDEGYNSVKSGSMHCSVCNRDVFYTLRGQDIASIKFSN